MQEATSLCLSHSLATQTSCVTECTSAVQFTVCGTNCCSHILIMLGKGDVMYEEEPQDKMGSDVSRRENGGTG